MKPLVKDHPSRYFLLIALILFFYTTSVQAQDGGYHKITAPEVQDMMKSNNVLIINSLSKLEYELQHIPGSINIPINTLREPGVLPANKNTPLIFYCMAQL